MLSVNTFNVVDKSPNLFRSRIFDSRYPTCQCLYKCHNVWSCINASVVMYKCHNVWSCINASVVMYKCHNVWSCINASVVMYKCYNVWSCINANIFVLSKKNTTHPWMATSLYLKMYMCHSSVHYVLFGKKKLGSTDP